MKETREEYWLSQIMNGNVQIEKCFSIVNQDNRQDVAESVIRELRNFLQAVICYIYEKEKHIKEDSNKYKELENARKYCRSQYKFNFLDVLYNKLNNSTGHINIYGEYAERILLDCFKDIFSIRKILLDTYSIKILNNIIQYPLDLDDSFLNYYKKIVVALNRKDEARATISSDMFYVMKQKTLFIDNTIFYEYTLVNAIDSRDKLDRFTAFSLIDIYPNYCIKATIIQRKIVFLGCEIKHAIIIDYSVSIRQCEMMKLAKIIGVKKEFSKTKSYFQLMKLIKDRRITIYQIIMLEDKKFEEILNLLSKSRKGFTYYFLKKTREIMKKKETGYKTLSYLLSFANNLVINDQLPKNDGDSLAHLFLSKSVFAFESNPFFSMLCNHIPKFYNLLNVFFITDENKGDFLARRIKYDSLESRQIYLKKEEYILGQKEEEAISQFNQSFSKKRLEGNKICYFYDKVFLNENEKDTIFILKEFLHREKDVSFPYYRAYAENQIIQMKLEFDDQLKKEGTLRMFERGSVFIVYGPAGSGKSFFASNALKVLGDNFSKVCIALTNPAVENMQRKINDAKATYCTIHYVLKNKEKFNNIDVLVIDECSIIPTLKMREILEAIEAKFIILIGDVFQIEPINFGNWFNLLKSFLNQSTYIELNSQYRSNNDILVKIWDMVRKNDVNVIELLTVEQISHKLDETIFEKQYADEIVLCLNYDGVYGINNINKILQSKNEKKGISWKQHTYKVGDPILFVDCEIYRGIFYNNLKGTILGVGEDKNKLYFVLKVNTILDYFECSSTYTKFVGYDDSGATKVFLSVFKLQSYDKDTDPTAQIPFQVAYAVSIHKAQGLEYDSVKVVLSNEVEERISHNIFYTAITRAKRNLSIYWSVETEQKIISNFKDLDISSDVLILKERMKKEI